MPLHRFRCRECGEEIEKIVMHEEREIKCKCGGSAEKKLSAPTFKCSRGLDYRCGDPHKV